MIPINPMSMLVGALMMLISLGCLCALIIGGVCCLKSSFRRYIAARRWRFIALLVCLTAGTLPMLQILGWRLADWQESRALSPRLDTAVVQGDLTLPVGTRIWMERLESFPDLSGNMLPSGLQSLKRGEFDRTPGEILGMRVRRLDVDGDRGLATLTLVAPARLQGWLCSAEDVVSFRFPFNTPFDFAGWQLDSCSLAPGSEVGGIVWPKGVAVHALEHGWWVADDGETPMRYEGLELFELRLRLDAPDGNTVAWDGVLAHSLEWGPVQYLAGTKIKSYQGNLLFSPLGDAPAMDLRSGRPVEPGHSVEQRRSGEVLSIHPNDQVGVVLLDVFTLE
ncbi:hypothetical protein KDX38_27510 [Pseudomonas sp. CDFA 602]|uniref:hypothetical protein n=1 Tax=Pseudomonas californiensis TaxID=2829823 RepID=UPI001E40FCD4|nr:hypothetical protein [Pseudomonas californiensis]MCD5997309.1 hypothetical protein [Pseudomonas californiensis]MCD6002910.1 hypothetical protein [Pseudomonas californiensis]